MDLFARKATGIDITDDTIEFIRVVKKNKKISLESKNRIKVPNGLIQDGIIQDTKKLKKIFQEAITQATPNPVPKDNVYVSLSDMLQYTTVITVDGNEGMSLAKLPEYIQSHIPVPLNKLVYTYQIVKNEKSMAVVVVHAFSRELYDQWLTFFDELNITLEGFDNQLLATFRALKRPSLQKVKKKSKASTKKNDTSQHTLDELPEVPLTFVYDFGSDASYLSLYDNSGLQVHYVSNIGGNLLTERISQNAGITLQEAEAKKVKDGLTSSKKVKEVLENELHELVELTNEIVRYYEDKNNVHADVVYTMMGGGSAMKGLSKFLKENLGSTVEKAALRKDVDALLTTPQAKGVYIGALGTALRGVEDEWSTQPLLNDTTVHKASIPKKKIAQRTPKKLKQKSLSKIAPVTTPASKKRIKNYGILALVLIVGAVSIFGAFTYRMNREQSTTPVFTPQYSIMKEFTVNIPVSIGQNTQGFASTRIQTTEIANTEALGDFDSDALREEFMGGQEDLIVVQEPYRIVMADDEEISFNQLLESDSEALIFPITLDWIILNKSEILAEALEYVEQELPELDYIINDSEISTVEIFSDEYLRIQIAVNASLQNEYNGTQVLTHPLVAQDSVDENIPEEDIEQPSQELEVPTVVILPTGVGFLNVRSGPGVTFEQVTQITPGEEYEFISVEDDWYELQLSDDLTGWVIGTFVEEI